jgi:membrane protein
VILPNVHVRLSSALLGAAVSAVLWQVALLVNVRLQVGAASYNALYSVFSAIPIFLAWTYACWLIVLVGAEVAASHQNEKAVRQRFQAERADQDLREEVALIAAAHVARDFLQGDGGDGFAELTEVPQPTLQEILDALVRSGLLARTVSGGQERYVPGRDPDTIRVEDVRVALRRDPRADEIRADVERGLEPGLRRVLQAAEAERRDSAQNLTLRELAGLVAKTGHLPA